MLGWVSERAPADDETVSRCARSWTACSGWVALAGRVVRPELPMTLPRSAADVLAGHVLFEIEVIDRMYLNLYQPRLQHGAGVASFFVGHRGNRFASSALMAPMTAAFVADIGHFAAARGLDVVRFAKGQRKDDVTREYLRRAALDDRSLVPAQVLYIGVAQEKQGVFRTVRRRNPVTGATYPWLVRASGVVNQYYFYCVDEEFGPVCVKFSGYFPYTGRLIINGNEYAKRQAAKAGIGFVPLDNAFAAVDDVAAVQAICDGLDEGTIEALAARLLRLLPHPFTAADTAAGYRYELSVLQAEFSLTQISALRAVAPLIAAMPPHHVARQVARLSARLDLDHATVTEAVTDALSQVIQGTPRSAVTLPASRPPADDASSAAPADPGHDQQATQRGPPAHRGAPGNKVRHDFPAGGQAAARPGTTRAAPARRSARRAQSPSRSGRLAG